MRLATGANVTFSNGSQVTNHGLVEVDLGARLLGGPFSRIRWSKGCSHSLEESAIFNAAEANASIACSSDKWLQKSGSNFTLRQSAAVNVTDTFTMSSDSKILLGRGSKLIVQNNVFLAPEASIMLATNAELCFENHSGSNEISDKAQVELAASSLIRINSPLSLRENARLGIGVGAQLVTGPTSSLILAGSLTTGQDSRWAVNGTLEVGTTCSVSVGMETSVQVGIGSLLSLSTGGALKMGPSLSLQLEQEGQVSLRAPLRGGSGVNITVQGGSVSVGSEIELHPSATLTVLGSRLTLLAPLTLGSNAELIIMRGKYSSFLLISPLQLPDNARIMLHTACHSAFFCT